MGRERGGDRDDAGDEGQGDPARRVAARGLTAGASRQGGRELPPGFLIGCASAAHQVEGGLDNDWSRMEHEHPERIRDRSTADVACDHHRRYREDLTELAAHGHTAHRFSVEWSRVEPRPGHIDEGALAHYADVVATCRRLGMEPVVTLHHFTLPVWLAAGGGARSPEAPARFARFATACTEAFGEAVRWWVTVNEPVILAYMGYVTGDWPPGRHSPAAMLAALRGLVRMHAAAATAIRGAARRGGWEVVVSLAHHERRLRPRNPRSLLDRAVAALPDHLFNRWTFRSARAGRLLPPVGIGRRVPGLAGSLDWIGLNYYCEEVVSFDITSPGSLFARNSPTPGLPLSAFGWAIDPAGLTRAILSLWEEFRLPVVVTENGVADEDDELRPRYIVDHLNAVLDAMERGADVRGYLHWTAMDNFEWAEGYTKRFGLLSVDRETLERRTKPSAALFGDICRSRVVPSAPPPPGGIPGR